MFNLVFLSRITSQPREHGTQEYSLEETIQVGVQMVSYPMSFSNEHRPFQCAETQIHLLMKDMMLSIIIHRFSVPVAMPVCLVRISKCANLLMRVCGPRWAYMHACAHVPTCVPVCRHWGC